VKGLLEEYRDSQAPKIAQVSKSTTNGQMVPVKEIGAKPKEITKVEISEMASFVRRAKAAGNSPTEYFDEFRYVLLHYETKLRELNKVCIILLFF